MSYIEREPLLEILNGLYNHHLTMRNYSADNATQDCINAVIEAPTADVVPKSEVVREVIDEAEHYITFRKGYAEKQLANKDLYNCEKYYEGRIDSYSECLDKLAELKKEYTENKE